MSVLTIVLIVIMLLLLPFFISGITSGDKKKADIATIIFFVGICFVIWSAI